jgi:hypothetical protein
MLARPLDSLPDHHPPRNGRRAVVEGKLMALSIFGHPAADVLSQRAVGARLARDVALEALAPARGQPILESHFLIVLAEPR